MIGDAERNFGLISRFARFQESHTGFAEPLGVRTV
jgi:hypothetical protein